MRTLTLATIIAMASILPGTSSLRVAEVFFVVDQKVVSQYLSFGATSPADAKLKIRADTEFLLTEVNTILRALSVELRVRRLDILDTDIFSDCETKNNQSVHQDFGLYSFDKYIRNNTLYAHLDYDMAILLTGYNIYGKDNATAGIAHNGKVCQEEGIGILEYTGTYHEVPSIVNEVSLILGLHHDILTCSDGYVMDPVMYPSSVNRWTFSPCSLENIGELIQSHACLNHTNPNSKKPDCLPTGDILDMDKMCRRWMRSARSNMCKNERFYNGALPHGDNVCQQVYCKVPGKFICVKAYPTDGMVCAEGKRCSMGKCSAAPDNNPVATKVDNSCVFGDKATLHIKGNSTTCAALMAKPENRRLCYDNDSRKTCCATCNSKKTSQPGCMYGDKHLINLTVNGSTTAIPCSAYLTPARTGNCYRDDMQDACCESCEKRKNPAKPDCMYGDKIRLTLKNATDEFEPLTCPEFLAKEGKSKCYRENIQAGCCETCEKHMDASKPECLFGDKITFTLKNATTPSKPLTCAEFIAQEGTHKCYRDNIQAGCCETCDKHKKNPTKPECLYGDKTMITLKSSPEPVTCSVFLPTENKVQCYRDEIEDACCDSCEKHKDPSLPDCQYGDRSKDCIKYSRDILCPSKLYAAICCDHCSGWKDKRSTFSGSHLGGVRFSALDRSPLATLFEETAGILPQLDDVITQYDDVGLIAE